MVSDYDDARQGGLDLETKGIDMLRGTGRLAGAGRVAVDDEHALRRPHRDRDRLGRR